MVGVDSGVLNDSIQAILDFVERGGVTFDVVQDQGGFGGWAFDYGTAPYPRQVLIDGDGIVRYLASTHDPAALAAAVEAVLEGR